MSPSNRSTWSDPLFNPSLLKLGWISTLTIPLERIFLVLRCMVLSGIFSWVDICLLSRPEHKRAIISKSVLSKEISRGLIFFIILLDKMQDLHCRNYVFGHALYINRNAINSIYNVWMRFCFLFLETDNARLPFMNYN
jgi:hypothetical protein